MSVADRHRAWLELVDVDGPFLAVPALKRLWNTGIPPADPQRVDALRAAKPAFEAAYDAVTLALSGDETGHDGALAAYRTVRDAWVATVLRDVLGWGDDYHTDGYPAAAAVLEAARVRSDLGGLTRQPSGALVVAEATGALVWVIDPVEGLRELLTDGWAHTPLDAMTEMLRAADVPIGLVTDGRWWGIVSVPHPRTPTATTPEGDDSPVMPSSGIVDALTWVEESGLRDAFVALLDADRLVSGRRTDRLTALFVESVAAAEEITVSLGLQVRRAVELLVQAFSESAAHCGQPDPLPVRSDGSADEVYQGAVTVMMRVVFLLFAQERGLLPQNRLFTSSYGLVGVLDELDARARDEGEEALEATWLTWHRLLATSDALHGGASFEEVRLPAYGGSLFDPDRFPFLHATSEHGGLAITVNDRVMQHVLRSVQVAVVKGEARRVSFRDIDVEQIGYIYEQLLGFTARRVDTLVIGMIGAQGAEPEVPVDVLDELAEEHVRDDRIAAAIIDWVCADQPSSRPPTARALAKALSAGDDADTTQRLLRSVSSDEGVRERLAPWIGIIRRDMRERPTVFVPGGLVVAETPSRRNAGAHYTPRSLAEEVVEHALAPLVYSPGPHQTRDTSQWQPKSSEEILALKVADIACGSGAFLVAAARYLARRLVEAWERQGDASWSRKQLEIDAIREVVAHCLYGADINPMAIEMCKLSLWLVSLDPKQPFSFVDDKLFCGNSLLGVTDQDQVEQWHIYPQDSQDQFSWVHTHDNSLTYGEDVRMTLKEAGDLRHALTSVVNDDGPQRSTRAKVRQLADLHQRTAKLRRIADGVSAAGLPLGGKRGKALNEAYDNLRQAVEAAYPEAGRDADPRGLEAILTRGLTPTVETDYEQWRPLHWAIEVPDVMERGGFDAIIGNPPFLGGQKLTSTMGTNVRDWLVHAIAEGTRGSADLVAYFFLRAMSLLNRDGTLGLIATNTVGQGDTREVGLDRMVQNGFTITRSTQSKAWPSASANLEYAAVWGTVGKVSAESERRADGVVSRGISPLLEPVGRVEGTPIRLIENAGIAFQGCNVLGMGFVIDEEQVQQWIAADPRNADVLFPYLNGEDLNSRHDSSASRWVIDFNERDLDEARHYSLPMARVLELVRPEREKTKRLPRREKWWQFAERAPKMRRAIRDLDEVLVIALVSKTVMPVRTPTGQVFSHALGVFATDTFVDQAVLSSAFHQTWAIKYGSTLETRVRYVPSDVFDTFPRPAPTDRLDETGWVLDRERREMMMRRQLGLTSLYNLVNDPDIQGDPDVDRMRQIHVEVDEAVLAAYGWQDVPLNHGFHTYRQMRRWTICPEARVEILDRLLEENHRRAARQGKTPPATDDATLDPEETQP